MMLSAWNEHDEGHWIEPALDKYGGAEKLQAIKSAIDGVKQEAIATAAAAAGAAGAAGAAPAVGRLLK